jgi:hypothetical protein
LLEGCLVGVPWPQRVDVALFRDDQPLANQVFKLIDGRSAECASSGLEGTTDAHGGFSGSRRQWSRVIALVDVEVRYDMLCIRDAAGWRQVWQLPYGPATKTLALNCDIARAGVSKWGACRVGDGTRWLFP